jgi:hypothetical protein
MVQRETSQMVISPPKLRVLFRLLIALEFLLIGAALTVAHYYTANASEDLAVILQWVGYEGLLFGWGHEGGELSVAGGFFIAFILVVVLPGMLLSYIGLWGFKGWARPLNVAIWIAGLVCIPYSGLNIMGPWEYLLCELSTMCGTAVLMLSYFSPLSECFDGRAAPAESTEVSPQT